MKRVFTICVLIGLILIATLTWSQIIHVPGDRPTIQVEERDISGHFYSNGAYVQPHYRSSPDGMLFNDFMSKSIINIRAYGATGNGITDDTIAIQASIDDLPHEGGIVYFPSGRYIISSPLVLPAKPVYLVGEGIGSGAYPDRKGTEIRLAGNSNCNMIEYTSTTRTYFGGIINMKLYGNSANQTFGSILSITGYWTDIKIERVYFTAGRDAEVYIQPPATGLVANVWIRDCLFENDGQANSGYGIQVDTTNHSVGSFWLHNNYFFAVKQALHFDGSGQPEGIRMLQMSDCSVVNSAEHGIYLKSVRHFLFNNNIIRNNGTSSANRYDGIFIDNDATGATEHVIITNNQFYNLAETTDYQRYGINLSGSNMDNILIENNVFADNLSSPAINIALGANPDGIIRNNLGFTTENSGTATIANGSTSVTVSHGLDVTPSARDIMVTPTNNMGNATKFYIDTYTPVQFTIHVDIDPGPATATFAWKAMVLGKATAFPRWDVNVDGVVDISDLILVGTHFGEDYRTIEDIKKILTRSMKTAKNALP